MKNIVKKTVKCPHCAGEMEISLDRNRASIGGDITVRCPHCKQNAVFAITRRNTSRSSSSKTCPSCGEEILSSASKCRFCGEWIDNTSGRGSSAARAVSKGIKQQSVDWVTLQFKLILLFALVMLVGSFVVNTLEYKVGISLLDPKYESWLAPIVLGSFALVFVLFAIKFIGQWYDE